MREHEEGEEKETQGKEGTLAVKKDIKFRLGVDHMNSGNM
jgi:hypothetical protein